MTPSRLLHALVLAAALLAPLAYAPAARAQSSNPYLNAAMRLYGDFEYDKARDSLKKARDFKGNGISEDLQIAIYSGLTNAELGDLPAAESDFKEALALDPNVKLPKSVAPKVAAVFAKARSELIASKPIAPMVTPTPVVVPPPVVTPPVVTPPVVATVTPPPKEIVLHKPPEDAPREPKPLMVTLPGANDPGSEISKPAEKHGGSIVLPVVLLGVGAGAGGAGAFFGSQSSKSVASAKSANFQSDAVANLGTARSQATTANVMYGVAGVAIVVGIITLIASQTGSD